MQKQQVEILRDRQVEYENAKKAYDDTKALFDIGAASRLELDDVNKSWMPSLRKTEKLCFLP